MFALIMTLCLITEPECVKETVAYFPQYDVGMKMCELAQPAIRQAIWLKIGVHDTVELTCEKMD